MKKYILRTEHRKFHYLYKITRVGGRFYIGIHSTDDLDDGYFGSGQVLWKSVKKYGKDCHTIEIIEYLSSRESLKAREKEIVNENLLAEPLCMNLAIGGGGGCSNKQRDKWDLSKKKKPILSEETKIASDLKRRARRHTPETKANMATHAKRRLKDGTMKTWATALSPEQRAKALQNSNGPQGKLCQYNLEGDLIKVWQNFDEALAELKVIPGRLCLAIKDPNVVCSDSLWRRKEEPKIAVDKKLLETRAKKAKLQNASSIEQLDDSGKIIEVWDSTSAATRTYGVRVAIDRALKTGCKAHGFYWRKVERALNPLEIFTVLQRPRSQWNDEHPS
jgi:hypothetical protein